MTRQEWKAERRSQWWRKSDAVAGLIAGLAMFVPAIGIMLWQNRDLGVNALLAILAMGVTVAFLVVLVLALIAIIIEAFVTKEG